MQNYIFVIKAKVILHHHRCLVNGPEEVKITSG